MAYSTVVLLYEVFHSLEVSAACAHEDTYLGALQIPERTCHEDGACSLGDRIAELAGLACEGSAHDDFAVASLVEAARFVDQSLHASAYRNVHEYVSLAAALDHSSYCDVLVDKRLLILDSLYAAVYCLGIDDYSVGRRRKLVRLELDAEALSYYRALLAHRIDVRKEVSLDSRIVLEKSVELFDGLSVFLLDGDDALVGSRDLHDVVDTSQKRCRILIDLSDVVGQARLALGCVHEDVSVVEHRLVVLAVIDLDECREARAALADDAGLFDHLEVRSLFDLLESLRLLCGRLDDDPVFGDVDDFAGYAGVNIGAESGRCSDELAPLDLVALLYDRFTWLAYSALLK